MTRNRRRVLRAAGGVCALMAIACAAIALRLIMPSAPSSHAQPSPPTDTTWLAPATMTIAGELLGVAFSRDELAELQRHTVSAGAEDRLPLEPLAELAHRHAIRTRLIVPDRDALAGFTGLMIAQVRVKGDPAPRLAVIAGPPDERGHLYYRDPVAIFGRGYSSVDAILVKVDGAALVLNQDRPPAPL